jgi:CheY-like chemotaxis protein
MSCPVRARPRRASASTVLIVEDNASVRGCLQAMFMALGYHADVAVDGQEALPKLVDGEYDAVICDLAMPRMDGDQLFEACCEHRGELARRFIFITGEALDTFPTAIVGHFGQPHLIKPFRMADIQAALSQVAAS